MTKSVFSKKYKYFLQIMIQLRKKAGITQEELAQKLGRPQSYVSKYEHGERRLDVIEFLEITSALGIDHAEILKKLDNA